MAVPITNAAAPSGIPESEELTTALALLLEARGFAERLRCDLWDFAVEIQCLRALGLSHSALRWLIRVGYAQAAIEHTQPHEKQRRFASCANLALSEATCFVLTEAGVTACRHAPPRPSLSPPQSRPGQPHLEARVPQWDVQCRELRWQGEIIKQFRLPAPNQEAILAALEEEGWPRRIDDPLPHLPDLDPQQRLHDTIKKLNSNQRRRLIRFHGDGTGKGVRWEAELG